MNETQPTLAEFIATRQIFPKSFGDYWERLAFAIELSDRSDITCAFLYMGNVVIYKLKSGDFFLENEHNYGSDAITASTLGELERYLYRDLADAGDI